MQLTTLRILIVFAKGDNLPDRWYLHFLESGDELALPLSVPFGKRTPLGGRWVCLEIGDLHGAVAPAT